MTLKAVAGLNEIEVGGMKHVEAVLAFHTQVKAVLDFFQKGTSLAADVPVPVQ